MQSLLAHLRAGGFDLAPEPLGLDDRGREVLSWIEGTTVGWALPWPAVIRSESLLIEVGQALAALHRRAGGFATPAEARWQWATGTAAYWQTYCHNDLAPYNVVLRDGSLAGIIDWDQAGPGDPRSDLAFTAWQWVPLHGPFVTQLMGWDPPPDRARRLGILLDAYRLSDRSGLVEAVRERIVWNRSIMLERAAAGDQAYQALVDRGHVGGMDEALAALAADGAGLQAAIEG